MKRRGNVISPIDSIDTIVEQLQQTDSSVEDGETVWVRQTQCLWVYRINSGLTPDGLNVVASLYGNGGVWQRLATGTSGGVAQTTWFIDSTNGNDDNNGLTSATALKTDAERQRRIGTWPLWTASEYHLRYLNDVPSTDPVIITGTCAFNSGVNIYLHSSETSGSGKAVLTGGNLTANVVTAENRPAGTPLTIQANDLPVSWTASGFVNQRCRLTSGANIGGTFWPAFDAGAKTAQISPPAPFVSMTNPPVFQANTFTPANGDTFVVESLTAIAVLEINLTGVGVGSSNSVVLDSVTVSSATMNGGASLFANASDWASTNQRQQFLGSITLQGMRIRANGRVFGSSSVSIFNGYADDSAAGAPYFASAGGGNTILRFITWQRQGVIIVGPHAAEISAVSSVKAWNIQSPFGVFNNTAGPGLTLTNCSFNASTFELWGVCGAGGTPVHLTTGNVLYYRAPPPGQANMYLINVAAAPAGAWISYLRAQAIQTSAPTFDYSVAPPVFTTVRVLTPVNLQNTNLGTGGLAGQWFDPLSGCGMMAK